MPTPPPPNLTIGGKPSKDCGCFNTSPAPGCFAELAFNLGMPNREMRMFVKDNWGGIYPITLFTDGDGMFIVPYAAFPVGLIGGTAKLLQVWFVLADAAIEQRILLTDAEGKYPFDCLWIAFNTCGDTVYGRITFTIQVANMQCIPPRGLKEQILTVSGLVLPDTELLIFNPTPVAPIVAELPPSSIWGLYPGRIIYFKDVSGATTTNYQRIIAAPNKIDTIDDYVDMSTKTNDREGRILVFSATFGWQNF